VQRATGAPRRDVSTLRDDGVGAPTIFIGRTDLKDWHLTSPRNSLMTKLLLGTKIGEVLKEGAVLRTEGRAHEAEHRLTLTIHGLRLFYKMAEAP